ncbi:excalibur calcium-binding domain-containing protein [Sphingomonas sp. TZW2008]|uniref:excalibur calcium-binding domain-containing protein n=1 Tax=Sphingomonas sp. TZW2008 TaxID=1917973 RepID=UPI000A269119|nr:excalibur calcium-binding domain-containing protein [Sphingomonas sp. TZW2008]
MRLAESFAVVGLLGTCVQSAEATPGGLNAQGCHNDRKGGSGYHCHAGPSAPAAQAQSLRSSGDGAFANCSAARAAGAAPVRRGRPGYGPHLDRDNDGVGCEQ